MVSPAIDIRDLRVDYGNFVAVDDISLTVPYGEVFGLVGPNGAGKTSTFSVLATLLEPTYGDVRIAGFDVLEETCEARRVIAYMPDLAPVPSDLKVWEFLHFHADTHSLGSSRERMRRVDECLEIVNMSDKRNSWCKKLSRGQTQRVVLAKTLLHQPRVLILDEPASGLDPLSRRDLRQAVQRLAEEGATVIVSSHILSELAEMCSALCVMNEGRILANGTAEEVRQKLGNTERRLTAVLIGHRNAEATAWLERRAAVSQVQSNGKEIMFAFTGDDEAQACLLEDLFRHGFRVKAFQEQSSSFEEILVEVAEGNRQS
ncbi:MAG: ABC transporter ATP-binding protein [Verrucomicrobiota bacterium]